MNERAEVRMNRLLKGDMKILARSVAVHAVVALQRLAISARHLRRDVHLTGAHSGGAGQVTKFAIP